MAGRIILGIANPALDSNGKVDSGATLTFYKTGTTTLQSVYSAQDLLTPLANPLSPDSAGRFPAIWGPDGEAYSVKWTPTGAGSITYDNITPTSQSTNEPISLLQYAKGDGVTDDTDAVTAWLAAIAGGNGYIPRAASFYNVPNGFTISGHSGTKIRSDPYAQILTTQTSGYAITMTNNLEVDFEFPIVNPGFSGLLMSSSASNTTYNKVKFERLGGTGRQSSKPSDPMANRIGIYIKGPALGSANYYHTIKPGTIVTGFDTGIAFQTPSGGSMNSNANMALGVQIEAYWYGFYTNSVENIVMGARFYAAAGSDGSNLTECVRLGDGTYATAFNYVHGTAEPGTDSQALNALANSTNNKVIIQDNCDHSPTDAGTNDWETHNTRNINSTLSVIGVPTVRAGTGATAGGVNALNLGTSGVVSLLFGSGAPTNSAGKGSLYLRTDGSGTSNRLYVNTDGSTTWTAVTTAA